MKGWCGLFCFAWLFAPAAPSVVGDDLVLVVVGAEGTKEYGQQFRTWATRWEAAAKMGSAQYSAIGLSEPGDKSDRELLRERLADLPQTAADRLWLVLIGHGTYDGKTARFNLRGPDITPADLAEWLQPVMCPTAVINCASSSGPFINGLSGPGRVIVTATKSGHEYNFARLGDYFSQAISDPKADLDKDQQTSLLEAYLLAAAKVREFYAGEARLATEQALLDDNADRLGTPADWFQGSRPTKSAAEGASLDGLLASQFVIIRSATEDQLPESIRVRRDEVEAEVAALRKRKAELGEDEYFKSLEPLLVELARLYAEAEAAANEPASSPPQAAE